MEVAQTSINGWMDMQNMNCIYDRMLFSLKKEGNSDTCYNTNEPWGNHAKWNKPVTKDKNKSV